VFNGGSLQRVKISIADRGCFVEPILLTLLKPKPLWTGKQALMYYFIILFHTNVSSLLSLYIFVLVGKEVKQHKSKTNKRLKKELAAFNGENLKEIKCPNSRKPRKKMKKTDENKKEDDVCIPCALQAFRVDFLAFWDIEDDLDADHVYSNSNNIHTMVNTHGVEAARTSLSYWK
nr:DNA-directed RNA polymerase I subunit 1 [Tanacetum cinerariifolium]